MGLVFWLYDRPLEPTLRYIDEKFGKQARGRRGEHAARSRPATTTARRPRRSTRQYQVAKAKLPPGKYTQHHGQHGPGLRPDGGGPAERQAAVPRRVSDHAGQRHLHELAKHKNFDVLTFQAEDEIAAMTAAIGAAFAGAMAVTTSSGPGIALKGEGMGLAVMTELPMIVINVQRGGPSTGLPTKTEQADLLQAMFGRNGECPMPVIAARSPADCFDVAQEAWRIAVRYMTPVMLLTDGYIANGSEPWRIPEVAELPKIEIKHPGPPQQRRRVPAVRARRAARPAVGHARHAGLEHRIGGLEKQDVTGNVNYEPANHQHMVNTRAAEGGEHRQRHPAAKARRPGDRRPARAELGRHVRRVRHGRRTTCRPRAQAVTHCHLRYLNPLPSEPGRHPEAVQEGADSRAEPGPAADC